jgi:hypothetical protein
MFVEDQTNRQPEAEISARRRGRAFLAANVRRSPVLSDHDTHRLEFDVRGAATDLTASFFCTVGLATPYTPRGRAPAGEAEPLAAFCARARPRHRCDRYLGLAHTA